MTTIGAYEALWEKVMPDQLVTASYSLPVSLKAQVATEADSRGIPASAVVRWALVEYLAKPDVPTMTASTRERRQGKPRQKK